jgi:2-oxo-3-hexenedioate decarboxylase
MSTGAEEKIAAEAFALLGTGRQVAPFTASNDDLTLEAAYRVTARVRRLREARGERVVGRKIGFTNRTIWAEYGVFAPIWGYVYDRTLSALDSAPNPAPSPALAGLSLPRIEPEIMFGFARAPTPGADEAALLDCIEWISHGFEIVHSIFPEWKLTAADSIAAYGLHGALLVGPRLPVEGDRPALLAALPHFEIELSCDGKLVDRGRSENVLGGPLSALRHLITVLAQDPDAPPLAAGEIVTTGTLTRAFPVSSGERWTTRLSGIDLPGIDVRFA